jgi:Na+/phosphate symporter
MFEEQTIKRLSEQYKFKCNIFYNSILINSNFRNWICEQRGQFYRLKHINGEQYKHKNHMHKKLYTNLDDVFRYINKHDTQVALDRHKNERLRIDKLYEQIHKY